MTFADLSHKLTPNVQIYPGDPPFTCHSHASLEKDGYNVKAISMGSHTGTHIDAPAHFFADGKTIDQLSLSSLVGPALVVDATHKLAREIITWDDLDPYSDRMKEGTILLIRTGWSKHWCTPKYYDHPYLDRDAIKRVLATGIRVVGVDTLNPDETPFNGVGGLHGFGVHETILGAGGVIAENLTNLEAIDGPGYTVSLVPLNMDGSDGSPVRAYAWKDSDVQI